MGGWERKADLLNLPAARPRTRDELVQDCAKALVDAFADYNAEFRSITQRARQRFEERDWRGSQRDAVERIGLYSKYVDGAVEIMHRMLGEDVHERAIWSSIKRRFAEIIDPLPDNDFPKTFFCSITRQTFGTVGVDPAVEFVALDLDPLSNVTTHVETKVYVNRGAIELLVEELLADFRFRSPYRDFERSVKMVADELKASLESGGERRTVERLEVIKEVFYQMTRAYLVGRITGRGWTLPFVVALRNQDSGVLVDAIMLDESTVSVLFSFTRSYFHVDLAHVGEVVKFLKDILPRKPVSELYTVLGRAKQGKTERYRELFRHLQHSDDEFMLAPGEKGLVMVCFTLPSFDVVFKLIRDKFPYQKNILRSDVLAKYDLVFRHDRAGRLPAAGTAHRDLEHGPRPRRGAPHRPPLHRAAHDAAQPVRTYCDARAGGEGGAGLRAGDPRPRGDQHLPRRPAAQEFWRDASRPRDLLRLRRTLPRHRLPLPRDPGVALRGGRDARRHLVLRGRQRRVPGDVHQLPWFRRGPQEGLSRRARRDADGRMVARHPGAPARGRPARGPPVPQAQGAGIQQPRMTQHRYPPAWLVGLLLLLAFAFQGTRGIWEPDEGRYTSAGLHMLKSGDWLVPTLDGEHPHLTKPPVTYWALASSFALLGQNEWAARLPGALAFVGTGLLLFGLGRRFTPSKPWLPPLVYALSLSPLIGASIITTDALLTFTEALAMYCFVRAYASPGTLERRWVRFMWVAWGLAFMTKGPPGLLPLFAMIAMLALGDRPALRRLLDPLGLAAFAAVAFTWFAILIAQEPSRFGYFVGYEVYDRIFTAKHDRNDNWYAPITIFGPMFIAGALPWWVLALVAAGGPRAAWLSLWSRLRVGDADWRLLAWWFLLPLAVFSLAQSRLQLYVLPLFVPLSLMLARPLSGWTWLTSRRLTVIAGIAALTLIGLKGYAGHVHTDRDSRSMARAIEQIVDPRSIDGIVFVGMRPFYGLNLYLDTRVEGIQIGEHRYDYSKFVAEEDLCAELAGRGNDIYALKQSRTGAFTDSVLRCDRLRLEEIGRFVADDNEIALFAVRR